MNSINFYDNMKAIQRQNFNNVDHFCELVEVLQTKFKYNGMQDGDPPPEYIEKYLITTGLCGFGICTESGRFEGDLIACHGSLSGDYDPYYNGTQFEGVYSTGNISGVRGETVAVGFNNTLHAPDFDVLRTESILTSIDVSEGLNVLFSRLLKIPVVKDNKDKEAIETVIKSLLKGDFGAVVSKNLFSEMADGRTLLEMLELTDVKDVDHLQYLNQYRDNVMKRFYLRHGHSLQNTGKIAQQSSDEIHGLDSVSLIYVNNQLEERRKMCDEVNRIFGRKWSVDFSDIWKKNLEEFEERGESENENEKSGSSADSANDDNTTD